MKEFFKNKVNVFLTVLLSITITGIGFLGYYLISDMKAIRVPDFNNANISDVRNWCQEVKDDCGCIISQEYSDSVEKDHVIYQSISADEKITDNISFIISLGKKIEIFAPEIKDTKIEDIKTWANDNNLTNVTYINENNDTVEKDFIIKIEPLLISDTNEEVKVYVSLGKAQETEPENNKDNNDDLYISKGKYKGLTEDKFKETVKALGLKPKYAESKDDYSDSVEKGKVVWHGSGSFVDGEDIRYGLSKGKKDDDLYISKGKYVGLTEDKFKEMVTALKLKPSYASSKDEYSDTVAKGNIIWHGSGSFVEDEVIRYGLSLGKEPTVNVASYKDKTEVEFKTYIESLKLALGTRSEDYSDTVAKGNIISNDTGDLKQSAKVNYKVSKGKDTRINVTSYANKSESEFESYLSNNGLTKGTKTQEYSDSIAQGYIISNDTGLKDAGSAINYKVSKGKKPVEKYTIMSPVYYASYCGKTFEETKNNLSSGPFANFTNVTYKAVDTTIAIGHIESISVAAGDYPADTAITIEIGSNLIG